ncbi:MAG TPA: RNA polymerase sigma factor [Bdellovibrionota bacterium]|nr:RNA polymerase sigma factor [Bdellovibrionota bacterium]
MAELRKPGLAAAERAGAKARPGEPDWGSLAKAARKDLARGDGPGLVALVDAVQPRLYRFCMFLTGDRQRAEDLCQESLVKAIENLAKLREPGQFLSWLFKMAKNEFLDQKRSARNRESETIDDLTGEEGIRSDALKLDPNQQTLAEVHEALSRLESEDRLLLILVDMEERSYAEAAEIIGITEAALRSRLHRARKEFERLFSAA